MYDLKTYEVQSKSFGNRVWHSHAYVAGASSSFHELVCWDLCYMPFCDRLQFYYGPQTRAESKHQILHQDHQITLTPAHFEAFMPLKTPHMSHCFISISRDSFGSFWSLTKNLMFALCKITNAHVHIITEKTCGARVPMLTVQCYMAYWLRKVTALTCCGIMTMPHSVRLQ